MIIGGNCVFVGLKADATLLLLLTGITWIKKRKSVNGISMRFVVVVVVFGHLKT